MHIPNFPWVIGTLDGRAAHEGVAQALERDSSKEHIQWTSSVSRVAEWNQWMFGIYSRSGLGRRALGTSDVVAGFGMIITDQIII